MQQKYIFYVLVPYTELIEVVEYDYFVRGAIIKRLYLLY
jgi:hypothetical protein